MIDSQYSGRLRQKDHKFKTSLDHLVIQQDLVKKKKKFFLTYGLLMQFTVKTLSGFNFWYQNKQTNAGSKLG